MGKSLTEIAEELKASDKKVQLIYAFNSVGKTRLSREFKELIAPKLEDGEEAEARLAKVLYYNAFTEDLFYWDNDLDGDAERKLKIQPNTFTDWIIRDRGQDQNVIANFQRYTDDKLTPSFIEKNMVIEKDGKRINKKTYPEVTFSFVRGSERLGNVKISQGEESNFVWSIFFTLLEEVIGILREPDLKKRDDNQFDKLEYVFIDDPVSSLDDNHLIELAVDIAQLIISAPPSLKFVVTTHNPLFFNVLQNELSCNYKENGYKYQKDLITYLLNKLKDGTFELNNQPSDSSFSYHLHLFFVLRKAVSTGDIQKYHFSFIRNILEKTATFLGYKGWGDLVPENVAGNRSDYIKRILNLSSHSKHAGEETALITESDKQMLSDLIDGISTKYHFFINTSEAS